MKIGNKIRKIRELKSITSKDMADRLDLSLNGYTKIERDEVAINTDRLAQISEIFNMKPEEVLSFDERFVFNNYDGTNTNYNQNIGPNHFNTFPEETRKLYEDKIALLLEKNKFLEEKIKFLEGK